MKTEITHEREETQKENLISLFREFWKIPPKKIKQSEGAQYEHRGKLTMRQQIWQNIQSVKEKQPGIANI